MRTSVLLPIGAALGLVGFLALAVEGVRTAVSDVSLSGWQSAVPWAGLGLFAVGAALVVAALLSDSDPDAANRS
ncbi:MAG: hypothetical protein JO079_05495 [Frankiaceae bacterium]|nr:hypothetical protein [Frankiaceae bacterium]MBV9369246.1 hypothetical protein [Frankiales bacterium]